MIKDYSNSDVLITSYSNKGFVRLRHNLINFAKIFNVNLTEEGILFSPETNTEKEFLTSIK